MKLINMKLKSSTYRLAKRYPHIHFHTIVILYKMAIFVDHRNRNIHLTVKNTCKYHVRSLEMTNIWSAVGRVRGSVHIVLQSVGMEHVGPLLWRRCPTGILADDVDVVGDVGVDVGVVISHFGNSETDDDGAGNYHNCLDGQLLNLLMKFDQLEHNTNASNCSNSNYSKPFYYCHYTDEHKQNSHTESSQHTDWLNSWMIHLKHNWMYWMLNMSQTKLHKCVVCCVECIKQFLLLPQQRMSLSCNFLSC